MSVEVSSETWAPTGGRSSDMGGGRTGVWRMRVVKFTNMGHDKQQMPLVEQQATDTQGPDRQSR